jgi:hypothetical protein
MMKGLTDRVAFHTSWVCAVLLIFTGGMIVGRYQLFPSQVLSVAEKGYQRLCAPEQSKDADLFRRQPRDTQRPVVRDTRQACEGLNLISRMAADGKLSVDVMDMDGKFLHHWSTSWFKIWPDAKHVPPELAPKSEPGTIVHGAVLLKNGHLVFNFEYLGLVCLDFNGNVVWRLPYQTHHSIAKGNDGNLWVCGQRRRTEPMAAIPNLELPFKEDMILEVTPEGKIAHEWSVVDLLCKNGREGLLYLGSNAPSYPAVRGDVLHLNDVEPFPSRLREGFFKDGDVLVSLRNIGTIFVFNRQTGKIKFSQTGAFVRQHDPDFVDGETISVFDNHTVGPGDIQWQSRILLVTPRNRSVKVFYEGTAEQPFFTGIMGKHQWLPNGNLLITEACFGRAFEIDSRGTIVWEYNNYIDKDCVSLLTDVTRLPQSFALLFSNSRLYAKALQMPRDPAFPMMATNPNGGSAR